MRYEAVYGVLREEYERLREYRRELEGRIGNVEGFVRRKRVNGKEYYYLCKRIGGKVVQVHIRPLSKEGAQELIKIQKLKKELREVNRRLKYLERLLKLPSHMKG